MTVRTTITGARVFDGHELSEPRTVVLEDDLISADSAAGGEIVDAGGAALLPGLIDAHIHLHGRDTLDQLAEYGVTTGLDMGSWPASLAASLRGTPGTADLRSAGLPAIGSGGAHAKVLGLPPEAVVDHPEQAESFVAQRVSEGVDYLKIVLEPPGAGGPEPAAAKALTEAAHARGLRVVAHAAAFGAFELALEAGVDVVTHVPLDRPLATVGGSFAAVPTLVMMAGMSEAFGRSDGYASARTSVGVLHEAGVPILAGTDANNEEGSPSRVRHGESLHRELELLVEAGLSTAEALRAATELPARYFGLPDRGVLEPGRRADVLLVDGDPVADIRATRAIRQVWCAGVPVG